MPTLNSILNTGVTSLRANQGALATVSHNISNTNTPGYTREVTNFATEYYLPEWPNFYGMGVKITTVQSMRDNLLDANYRSESGQQSKYDVTSTNASSLESVLGDINGTSIGTGLTDFFNAYQDLSNNPADSGTRQTVLDKATQLVGYFNTAAQRMSTIADTATQTNGTLDETVIDSTTQLNTMLQQVAALNKQIVAAETPSVISQAQANDLRDQRGLLLDQLSSYMDLTVTPTVVGGAPSDKMIDITVNGQKLVVGQNANPVAAAKVVFASGNTHLQIQAGGVSLATAGGKIAGYQQAYTDWDTTNGSLNDLAKALVNTVNTQHTAGFDQNGVAGVNFFDPAGTTAATIALNPVVSGDPSKIAAASTNTGPGDGNNAVAIAQLQDALVYPTVGANPNTMTLNGGFTDLVTTVGSNAQTQQQFETEHQTALDTATSARQAVEGVNTDEELTNLVDYQQAYQAAARIVTAVDDDMSLIISHMGRVGL
ncbi:MAG: flagellar hook-associated protein FlgK [Planctomycetota bacterium]